MNFELTDEARSEVRELESSSLREPAVSLEELEMDCEGDPGLTELLEDMVRHCLLYTITVAKFKRIALQQNGELTEARVEIDKVRGKSHDAMIASVNALTRELAKAHADISWADFNKERVRYAKFALTLTLTRI